MPVSSALPARRSTFPYDGPGPAAPTLAALLSAVVLTLAMVLGSGGAASAHDELVSSNPAAEATVDVVPPAVELTYSNVPSGIGAQVQVLDEAGTDWADGPVELVNRTATQAVRAEAPAGEYTVNWRVVSSDSHPIEGSFVFTAQGGTAAVPDAATTAGPMDEEDPPSNETQMAGVSDFPWSVVLMIGVLVVIVAGLGITARRRLGARK